MSTQRSGPAGPGLALTRLIGLRVTLLEYIMLDGKVLGGALAGSCSERRPWQPSAQSLGPRDLIFEVPPTTSTPTTAFLLVRGTKYSLSN
jgi:hypothetical protein